jgi:hypothetical protein
VESLAGAAGTEAAREQPSTAAVRAKRFRERKRRGDRLVSLVVTKEIIDILVGRGLVPESERANDLVLCDAIIALARVGLEQNVLSQE